MRRLELCVPSIRSRIRPAVERVVEACSGEGVGPGGGPAARGGAASREGRGDGTLPVARRLRVAVGEALANAVIHGNGEDPRKAVRITAEAGPGGARVVVQDEGRGFDPGAVPDPTRPAGRQRDHGRGLHLQRRLADRLRHEDGGRRVELFFFRG